MPLTQTQEQYYGSTETFTGDGTTTIFTLSTSSNIFSSTSTATIYIDGNLILPSSYQFRWTTTDYWHVDFSIPSTSGYSAYGAPANGVDIRVNVNTNFGNYQFIPLEEAINNFMISHVGEGKIISKVRRTDVAYHAQRALQELSYDTLRSVRTQEIEVPASLKMILPQDYVGYVKLTWVDSSGVEHVLYPARKTSNPTNIKQETDGSYSFDKNSDGTDDTTLLVNPEDSDTWSNYKSTTPSENQDDYQDDTYWPHDGRRYGLDPQHAQANGTFFIDQLQGYIHFSSNISGRTVILKYISDGLSHKIGCKETDWNTSAGVKAPCDCLLPHTQEESKIHKFAEEALYKHIAYAVLSTKVNIPEYIVMRFKKERFAETRKAKLRLSNLKLEELTQALRGKSKQIKH